MNKPAPTKLPAESSSRWFTMTIVAVFVIGAAAIAILANSRTTELSEVTEEQTASVDILGEPLERLPFDVNLTTPDTDAQAGVVAPTIVGTNFDGEAIRIKPDGRAKAIYFLAHWCPHCQAEVPAVNELVADGLLPDDLDIYAVSTGVDRTRGNYPPERWLETEGFEPPVIRDDDASTAFGAYGGTSFPYAVYLNADHRVVARSAGQLGKDGIAQLWLAAANGTE